MKQLFLICIVCKRLTINIFAHDDTMHSVENAQIVSPAVAEIMCYFHVNAVSIIIRILVKAQHA